MFPPSLIPAATAACLILLAVGQLVYWARQHRAQRQTGADRDGDVTKATEIRPLLNLDVANTQPYPYRPWKSGKFVMSMGIQKVRPEEWLHLDNRYWQEQELRRGLLTTHREKVMQILPGAEAACAEMLELVVSYLTQRFPELFFHPSGKPDHLYNSLTKRTFRVSPPYEIPPLEVAAQLVMEDLNLLIQGLGDDPEQHYLYSMAPAGWHLEDRIGWPLWKLHSPVPLWEETLRKSVEKYFLKMKPEPISRHNFFIQTNDVLFQQEPFLSELPEPPKIEEIRLRHERQTLRRLPKTRAILFTVRTYITPITDLQGEPESVRELLGAIRAMPPEIAKYKARQVWGSVVEGWCEQVLKEANSDAQDNGLKEKVSSMQ